MKFVEQDDSHILQCPILLQPAQQNAFGHEADASALRRDVLESDLVSDFVAELAIALGSDARGEKTRGEAARLENDDLTVAEQSVIEQDLWDLGGFSRAGRGLDD